MSSRPFDDEELDDDEFDDDDFEDFEEDDDEDRFSSRSSSTSTPSARVGGAGLPASSPRPPSQGGSVPSPIRSPNAPPPGSSARPPGSPAPGSGGVQPFQRPGSTGSTNDPLGKVGAPSGSSSGGGAFSSSPRPPTPGSGGSSSGSGSSPFSSGSQQRPPTPGGSSSGSGSSPLSSGQRPPTPGSSSGSNPLSSGQRPPTPGGGSSSPFSSSAGSSSSAAPKKDDKTAAKADDKGKGGGLGGLFNRGGDDKKNASPSSSTARPASSNQPAAKKDDKGGGSPLGKIGGLFGGGDKKGNDKSAPKPPSSSTGSSSSFGSSSSSSSNRPFSSSSSGGSSSGLGSSSSYSGTGSRPGSAPPQKGATTKKASGGSGGVLGRFRGLMPFAQKKQTSKNARAAREGRVIEVRPMSLGADKALEIIGIIVVMLGGALLLASLSPSPGSLIDNVNGFVSRIFGWGAIFVPIAMIPIGIWMVTLRVGQETPSIDITRIVGLILLFLCVLAAMQFFDALSYPPGENQSYPDYMSALKNVLLPLSSEFGRGGGRIGGEIYYFLVSNFSELAGFVLLIGLLLIALMLTFSISAQEVIAILVGNWRNLRDAYHRRTVRVRAQRAEKAAVLAASSAAGGDITVSRDAGALPMPAAGASPALPAGAVQQPMDLSKTEERSIPITMGGRTFSTSINAESAELVTVGSPDKPASAPAPVSSASMLSAAPDKTPTKEETAKGGLFGRIRSAAPVIGTATVGAAVVAAKALTPDSESPESGNESAAAKTDAGRFGGIGGRLFNRTEKPAASTIEKSAEATAVAATDETKTDAAPVNSATAAISDPAITTDKPAGAPPARLGDLARSPGTLSSTGERSPASPPANDQSGVRPFAKPVSSSPISPPTSSELGTQKTSLSPPPPTSGEIGAQKSSLSSPSSSTDTSADEQPLQSAGSSSIPPLVTSKPGMPPVSTKPDEAKPEDKPVSNLPASSSNRSLTPMQPVRPASSAPRNPFHNQDLQDEDDEIEDLNDSDESEDWSRLPPARPKTNGTPEASHPSVSPPGNRSPVESPAARQPDKPSDPAKRDEESIPDLQTRLQALRNMQVAAASPKPASDASPAPKPEADASDKPEDKGGTNLFKVAGVVAAGAVGSAVNKLTRSDDDEEVLERPPAVVLPKPEPRTPSSAYGKPDDGIRDPAGTMATSRPAPLNSPRPFPPSDEGTKAAPASTPVPAATSQPPVRPAPPPSNPASPPAASAAPSQPVSTRVRKEWRAPQMPELLSSGLDQELDKTALVRRAKTIEETLASFGAPGRVVEVRTGPVITQFGVEPDYVEGRGGKKARVKVSTIAALDKDLQLSLGAKSIRIEAPVPGKGYVGIEVPNEKPAVVKLRDVMESQEFRKIQSPLAIALGQGVDGTPVAADLASMPHLLIAGTTGSGKSVCVNTIIASLLLRNSPERVKLIMVDPKRVELTGYNGIPHLVAPVVVELERIVSVLKWVTREMDERYRRFALASARNIEDYNKHLPSGEPPMPYIVLIIDELADLMMLAPDETEKVITRLAALARATGIHLVIATQRPSVDVVTGLIKANFPARIAFAVAGGVDSRVILDQPGAEKLLGRGDMLYMSGDAPAPVRLQGVYVSDTEINNITRFWRNQMTDADMAQAGKPLISQFALDEMSAKENRGKENGGKASSGLGSQWDSRPPSGQSVFASEDDDDDDMGEDDDELYEQAVDLVRRQNKASVSLLQRRFRIGYTRAARLMDVLEERGVVGPPVEGAKPREVLPPR